MEVWRGIAVLSWIVIVILATVMWEGRETKEMREKRRRSG